MKRFAGAVFSIWLAGAGALAQQQGGAGASAAAAALPSSGRNGQAGSVGATEQAVAGTTTSVNTLNPSVQVSGPYGGSARSDRARPFSGKLSLKEALERGLEYNLGAVASAQAARQSGAQATAARSALLPNINAGLTETAEQNDLAALGLRISGPGFRIPTIVGPFNYFALQASLSQTIANFTTLNNYRAAKATARASQYSAQDARDLITLAVGGAYLQTVAAQARVEAAEAQLATANAVFHESSEQHGEGVLGRLNVDQSQLRTLTEQQRIITLRNDLAKQKINLARLTGLPPTDAYELTDRFGYSPETVESAEAAVARAEKQRADVKAAEAQVEAAEKALSAARGERLPSLGVSGYYEAIGVNPSQSHGAFAVTGTLSVPVWQGGKTAGDIAQAQAALAERQAELEDARGEVEAEVRQAYLDLQAANGQVEVSRKNVDVANETLEMARERMQAGVINTVEVVQAQETVAGAQLDLIDSIFAHNLAKLSLARALGEASGQIGSLLAAQ